MERMFNIHWMTCSPIQSSRRENAESKEWESTSDESERGSESVANVAGPKRMNGAVPLRNTKRTQKESVKSACKWQQKKTHSMNVTSVVVGSMSATKR